MKKWIVKSITEHGQMLSVYKVKLIPIKHINNLLRLVVKFNNSIDLKVKYSKTI